MIPASQSPPSGTDEFIKGIWKQNPVFVHVLGMCPVLAVTNTAKNALAMGLATAFVLIMSNLVVSSLRRYVPKQVRIVTFILVIATFVTIVDYLIQAISLELHKALGAFISLIVVNCLILGRAEAFASKNGIYRSLLDGLGMGVASLWPCSAWAGCVRSWAAAVCSACSCSAKDTRNGSSCCFRRAASSPWQVGFCCSTGSPRDESAAQIQPGRNQSHE